MQTIEARRENNENRIGNIHILLSDRHEIEKHDLPKLFKVVQRDMQRQ